MVDDLLKSLQNALKHFMSWEPVKFNMNYILLKDQTINSEELPAAVDAISAPPIVFHTEVPVVSETRAEEPVLVSPPQDVKVLPLELDLDSTSPWPSYNRSLAVVHGPIKS